ncbi:MAG: hypothetical protein LBC63_05835 [Holophagales bacterium]|nr:hypothetical protein [Holophagales bacterium]
MSLSSSCCTTGGGAGGFAGGVWGLCSFAVFGTLGGGVWGACSLAALWAFGWGVAAFGAACPSNMGQAADKIIVNLARLFICGS